MALISLVAVGCANEEVKQENSNKNPTVNSVQRDYMAGEVSKDLTRRRQCKCEKTINSLFFLW